MDIKKIPLKDINTASYNPRTIDPENFAGLRASLKKFGQKENLVVNKDMTLISGHQRLAAMLELGWTEAQFDVVDLNKTQEKLLNIALNNKAIQGKFDDERLGMILSDLKLDDSYAELRMDKLEPLDLGGVNETSLGDAEAPSKDSSHVDLSGGVKQYTVVFDDDEQQERFLLWLRSLRTDYPDYETNAGRIMAFLDELG